MERIERLEQSQVLRHGAAVEEIGDVDRCPASVASRRSRSWMALTSPRVTQLTFAPACLRQPRWHRRRDRRWRRSDAPVAEHGQRLALREGAAGQRRKRSRAGCEQAERRRESEIGISSWHSSGFVPRGLGFRGSGRQQRLHALDQRGHRLLRRLHAEHGGLRLFLEDVAGARRLVEGRQRHARHLEHLQLLGSA